MILITIQVVRADAYVGALDVPGAKKMIPESWRRFSLFSNIDKLVGVPVITVQLRYNGWVTEMQDPAKAKNLQQGAIGIDNLLYRCVACVILMHAVTIVYIGHSTAHCWLPPSSPPYRAQCGR